MAHDFYNRDRFPILVVVRGNWELRRNDAGYCASIPTPEAEADGCKASHFGDCAYVRATLGIDPMANHS